MTIAVTCKCGKRLRVREDFAGKNVVCPACKATVMVPDGAATDDVPQQSERRAAAKRPAATEKANGLRNRVLVGAGVAVVVIFGIGIGLFGWFRGGANKPDSTKAARTGATITAAPNPVPVSDGKFGKTTITWDTGDGRVGEVYVSVNGKPEKKFAGNRPKGSLEAPWIGKGEHEFRLYAGKEHKDVLASVKVTRSNP